MSSALLIKLALFAVIISIAYSVGIYEQCAGEGYGSFPCPAGLGCFRRNKWFSSCQPSCPRNLGWECEAYIAPVATIAAGWDQCGGQGWYGPAGCPHGYACYARSVYYSQCRPYNDCPAGWGCAPYVVPVVTTVAPVFTTVAPVFTTVIPGPIVLGAYAKCNDVAGAICPTGTGCFRSNALYSECRPFCPPTWACENDVAGLDGQCGGEGYVGLTRCAEGYRCFALSKWYSRCAASCPGVGWAC